jgi:alanyl-tRNA synthetase
MRFTQLILVCLIILVFSNTSSNEITEEQEKSLSACLKLKKQAPYLNLKCENILEKNISEEKQNITDFKSDNLREDNSTENFRTISFEDIKANTKKINATDEKRLRKLIKQLKN